MTLTGTSKGSESDSAVATGDDMTLYAVLTAVIGTCLICLVIGVIVVRRHRKKQSDLPLVDVPETISPSLYSDMPVSHGSHESTGNSPPMQLELEKRWQIAHNALQFGAELGRGNFGVVYHGEYDGSDAVIKQLHIDTAESRDDLLREAAMLATIKPHASLVSFYGVCVEPGYPPCLVTEFVEGGNLEQQLRSPRRYVSGHDVCSLTKDLAAGLLTLHKTGILHLDIAARNLLVVGANPMRLRICEYVILTFLVGCFAVAHATDLFFSFAASASLAHSSQMSNRSTCRASSLRCVGSVHRRCALPKLVAARTSTRLVLRCGRCSSVVRRSTGF
jgi:serine/threonine protein kinase